MIIAAIANLAGGLLGLAPDVLKEWRAGREHARELEHMEKLAEIQRESAKLAADSKIREIDAGVVREEMQATRAQLTAIIEAQARPTGIAWVDAFNAVLRPACTSAIMLIFFWVTVVFVWSIVAQYAAGAISPELMARLIFESAVGESFQAVLGFLYGYRSTVRK